jgi:2C-methyl-D-erythritol 2,4-cyclodiphosphate synthase
MSNLILEKVYNVKNIDAIVEETTNKICELNPDIKRCFAELIVWNLVHTLEKEILDAKK